MEYIKYCHGKWVNKYGNQYDQVIDKNEVMKSLEAETFETKTVFQKRDFANEHDDLKPITIDQSLCKLLDDQLIMK